MPRRRRQRKNNNHRGRCGAARRCKAARRHLGFSLQRERAMRRIREILLNQYIGAIASGLILAQTAFTAITIVSQPLTYYFGGRSRARSIFGATESAFPWNSLVGPVINLV